MKCPTCKAEMKPLATSLYCPNDCDRPKEPEPSKYPDMYMDFKEHRHPNPLKSLSYGTVVVKGATLRLQQSCPIGTCGYFLIHAEKVTDGPGGPTFVGYCGGQKLAPGAKPALEAKHIWSLIPHE